MNASDGIIAGPSDQIRILIADDHAVVRLGVRLAIENRADMVLVGEARNAAETMELASQHQPDILLLDLRMPGAVGPSVIVGIVRSHPRTHVLIFSSYASEEEIYQSLHHGARGFLTKDATRDEIINAIREVHRGGRYIPPAVAGRFAERLQRSELTRREMEILNLLADGKTNRDIGRALQIAESTVKNHIKGLLTKLGANDRLQAIHITLGRGLIINDPHL